MKLTGGTTPFAWSATGLPVGLTINATTGVISGTPTSAGTVTSTVKVTDGAKLSHSVSFPWATGVLVTNPGMQGVATGTAASLPMKAAGGTTPYTWSATGLPAGLTINATTGVIAGTATTAGSYTVTVNATDTAKVAGSAPFTLNVGPAPVVTSPGNQSSPTLIATTVPVTATGGTAPYKWSATGLPAGLSIDIGTGTISGTPATAGTTTATVTATDAKAIPQSVSFTWATGVFVDSVPSRGSATGTAVSLAHAARGGTAPYKWSATGLPAGLTINATTGAITGTPTATATYTTKITATDAAAVAGSVTFTWNTGPGATVTTPGAQAGTTGTAVSKTISATAGTTPYQWTATGLPAGLMINAQTGVVTGTPTAAGSSNVTVTVTDAKLIAKSVAFTWAVTAPLQATNPGAQYSTTGAAVSKTLTAAGGTGSYSWTATGLPAGLMINAQTGAVTGTPTTAGSTSASVTVTDTAGRTHNVAFAWTVSAPLAVDNPGAQTGTTGTAVAKTVTAKGGAGPYTWAATGLPAGLMINVQTGVVSGTPTTAGSTSASVTVTDAAGRTSSTTFTWAVVARLQATNPGTQNATTGEAVSKTLAATGGTGSYTWAATGLPAGLMINAQTGAVTGTPTTAGSNSVTVTVADTGSRTDSVTFTWAVGAPLILDNPGAQDSSTGTAVSKTIVARGGTSPYAWTATGLPTGLMINAQTGVVTGTPTTADAPRTVVVKSTDAVGRMSAVTFAWTVSGPVIVTDPGPQQAVTGGTVSLTVGATGGASPYTWSASGLPAGLAIDAQTGVVTGTPMAAGSTSATVTATDTVGRTNSVTFTYQVVLGVPAQMSARAEGAQTVHLAWVAVPGATGYQLYRNDELVAVTGWYPGFIDRQLEGATTYRYQVKAVDADGRDSGLSMPASVTTDALPLAPVNFARCEAAEGAPGCPYAASVAASATYPDTGHVSLTDGVHGTALYGPAWQGRDNVSVYSFTVDLGTARPITEINSSWFQVTSDFTMLPPSVTYLTSADGVTFAKAAYLDRPNVSSATQIVTYRAVGLDLTARYVKVELDGGSAWTMTDEVEIRGADAQLPPVGDESTLDFQPGPARNEGESLEDYLQRIAVPVESLAEVISQVKSNAKLPGAVKPAGAPESEVAAEGRVGIAATPSAGDRRFQRCQDRHEEAKKNNSDGPNWYYDGRFYACQVNDDAVYEQKECDLRTGRCKRIGITEYRLTVVGEAATSGRYIDWYTRIDKMKQIEGAEALQAISPLNVQMVCEAQTSDGGSCAGSPGRTVPLSIWKIDSDYHQRTEGLTTGSTGWSDNKFSKLRKKTLSTDPKVSTFSAYVQVTNPLPSLEDAIPLLGKGQPTIFRCDTAQYIAQNNTGGCVFSAVPGYMEYDYAGPTQQESVHFFYLAYYYLDKVKKNPVPGVYIPGSAQHRPIEPMTRNVYEQRSRSKVRAECRRQNGNKPYSTGPNGTEYDCDEIPFNSTYQAAPFVDDKKVNTPVPGTGPGTIDDITYATWAARPVKRDHNSATGNALGVFYQKNRILSQDEFYVSIKNAPETCAPCADMPPMAGPDLDPLAPLPIVDPDTDESFTDGETLPEIPLPPINIYGDPHLTTLDGLHYDLQSVGEFDFASSAKYGLRIQTRFTPMGETWSGLESMATMVNGHRVEFTAAGGMRLDGKDFTLPGEHLVDLGGDATVRRTGGRYVIAWGSTGDGPVLAWSPGMTAGIGLSVPADADLRGLLGNGDKDPQNDLKLRDGTQLRADTPASVLHGTYADSWRIAAESSLFTYKAGQSTATFTDKTYPKNVVTINSLTASEVAAGTETCTAHGVTPGPQFEACVVDVVLTGNAEFAAMAAQRKEVAIDPRAANVNAAGDLGFDFEAATLPSNLAPTTLTTDAATTSFAGPFSGRNASYRFFAQQLPAHLQGSLSFDVITIGDWYHDADTEKVALQIDRKEVWTKAFDATVAPQRTGTLGNGQPFAVHRVTVPLSHMLSQLEAVFTATGVDGLANQGFGIDNVALHVTAIPPQVFETRLPLTAPGSVGVSGAGYLEASGVRDEYRFTVQQGEELYIDPLYCVDQTYLEWQLLAEATGTAVAHGGCGDARTQPLAAGTYRLIVGAPGDHSGPYVISAFVAPAAQQFDVTLPLLVKAGQQTGNGAGNLETKASVDQYRFTLQETSALVVTMQCADSYCPKREIVNTTTGEVTALASSATDRTKRLPAGTYRLVVSSVLDTNRTGPYGVEIYVVPPAQLFDVSLPISVADGAPAAGAGNLEARSSSDEYRFTLSEAQEVYIDVTTANRGCLDQVVWTLVDDATGAMVETPSTCSKLTKALFAGRYRLVVDSPTNKVTTYQVRIKQSPPQVFHVTLPLGVTGPEPGWAAPPRSVGAGSGVIEDAVSRDQYRFTLAEEQTLRFVSQGCAAWGPDVRLTNTATGAVLGGGRCYEDQTFTRVQPGSYQLQFTANNQADIYAFDLFVIPPKQTFEVAFPVHISDDVPALGAGNMETLASVDEYQFVLPAAQALYFDVDCPTTIPQFFLLDEAGDEAAPPMGCRDERTPVLPAGKYRLRAESWSGTGAYTAALVPIPAAQKFDISLPTEISSGVPGAGAGVLEDKRAVDEYHFTLDSPQYLYVDAGQCTDDPAFEYRVADAVGGSLLGSCGHGQSLNIDGMWMEAGEYTITVRSYEERAGTYRLKIKTLPEQKFAVSLPVAISAGVPRAGAGTIEPGTGNDLYEFDVAAGQRLYVTVPECPAASDPAWADHGLTWNLGRFATHSVWGYEYFDEVASGKCSDGQTEPLPAGRYALYISTYDSPMNYRLKVGVLPPPA
ncbi:hypothetical protein GCM10023107_89430 [Actinoplanes octamycinicus]